MSPCLDAPASLRHAALRPRSLVLATPELRLVRLADGAITLEGVAGQSDRVLHWLLAQPRAGLSITGGDAYTDDLVMAGPSVRIDISGRAGLERRDYDQSVIVTPSIAGTLPRGRRSARRADLFRDPRADQ